MIITHEAASYRKQNMAQRIDALTCVAEANSSGIQKLVAEMQTLNSNVTNVLCKSVSTRTFGRVTRKMTLISYLYVIAIVGTSGT